MRYGGRTNMQSLAISGTISNQIRSVRLRVVEKVVCRRDGWRKFGKLVAVTTLKNTSSFVS